MKFTLIVLPLTQNMGLRGRSINYTQSGIKFRNKKDPCLLMPACECIQEESQAGMSQEPCLQQASKTYLKIPCNLVLVIGNLKLNEYGNFIPLSI